MKQVHPQRGFSLLEMLIAVALMAMLASLSWRALDTTTRSSERLNTAVDQTLNLLRTLSQLETDIIRHADADILGPPLQGSGSGVFPSGIRWSSNGLVVLRSSYEGAWQEVVWTLADGKLWRAAGEPVRTLPLPPAASGEVMLDDVKSFSVRAWLPG